MNSANKPSFMYKSKPSLLLAFLLIATSLLTASAAAPASFGVKFQGRNSATLAASDFAGVPGLEQRNWNIANDSGGGVNNAVTGNLVDSNAVATGITMTWSANDSWNNDGPSTTPNDRLMHGISKQQGVGTAAVYTFNNVPSGFYRVLVYCNVNGDGRDQDVGCGNVTNYFTEQHQFGGAFIESLNTSPGGTRTVANFVKFINRAPVGGQIVVYGVNRSVNDGNGIAAIQMVSAPITSFTFLDQPADAVTVVGGNATFSASVTAGTAPYTYQWRTNGVTDPSATGTSYTRSGVAANEGGRTFQVVATDSTSLSITSRLAVLRLQRHISVNFVGRDQNGFRFDATDVAGVVPLTNWNMSSVSGEQPAAPGDKTALQDDRGVVTTATLHWECNDSWNTASANDTPNTRMMKGIAKDGNGSGGYFLFQNLPPGAAYDVYVYTSVNNGGGSPGSVNYDIWVTNQLVNNNLVAATNYNRMADDFSGTFGAKAENLNPAGARASGYYVKFDNVVVTADGKLYIGHKHVSGGDGAGFPGIQLVYLPPVPDSALSFTAEPVNQSVVEGFPFSFSIATVGSPRVIRWYTNGVLVPNQNSQTYKFLDEEGAPAKKETS